MARPVDINLLLKKKEDKGTAEKKNLKGKITKQQPTLHINEIRNNKKLKDDYSNLYTKGSLNCFIRNSKEQYLKDTETYGQNTLPNIQKPPIKNIQNSKFKFGWNNIDDTLSGFKPIVNLDANDLLQNNNSKKDEINSLESSYLGKHWSEKGYSEMTDRDWRIVEEDFDIKIKGGKTHRLLRSWEDLSIIPEDMLDVIKNRLNFLDPSPIQRVAIPNICQRSRVSTNRDFMGIAETGSGKTMSFVLPILIKLSNSETRPMTIKKMEGPKALILAPTRELAQQIQAEIQNFIQLWAKKSLEYISLSIVGGYSIEELSAQISKGMDILVATPGRLIDCLESHLIVLKSVDTLVLDEADKMIDLGFEDQLTTILSHLNSYKTTNNIQTMMFSATMSPKIEKLTTSYLHKPVYATVGSTKDAISQIKQVVRYAKNEDDRFEAVKKLLNKYMAPIIIFINYKKTADWLFQKIQAETTYSATILHGSKSQDQREHSVKLLREGKTQVLIATNVAARGIDIPNVSLVINLQMSKVFEDYVHRIGRTGRAGNKGTAITFIGDDDDPLIVKELFKYISSSKNNTSENKDSSSRLNYFDKELISKYDLKNSNGYNEILY